MSDQMQLSEEPQENGLGSAAPHDESVEKLKEWRIDAWMHWLCVWLIVLGPVITLFELTDLSIIQKLFRVTLQQVTGKELEWLAFVATLPVTVFGVWSGLSLWGIRKGAVPLAKTFLKVDLVASLARNAFIAMFFQNSNEAQSSVMPMEMIIQSLTRDIPFFFIWNTYLSKSKRVRKTFGL